MDDTQDREQKPTPDDALDGVDALAAMDPADAPQAAERLAAELADELEEAGGVRQDPVQLRADIGEDGPG